MVESGIKLLLKKSLDLSLEAPCVTPDSFARLSLEEIASLPVQHGKEKKSLGHFFTVTGTPGEDTHHTHIFLEGELSRLKYVGYEMTGGSIMVQGSIGLYLGARMEGGTITVNGNADDYAGVEMKGGTLRIKGNAGHYAGAALQGARLGMNGGNLFIEGNCGDHLGQFMSRGVIYIGGSTGGFPGSALNAGTILVKETLGRRPGANMNRGTIIVLGFTPEILPTFVYEGVYSLTALRLIFNTLSQEHGFTFSKSILNAQFIKYRGDRAEEKGQGELFLLLEKNQHLLP